MLANRHDWLSAFSNELGVVLAVERMLGMEVPERAVWMRTLLAELNRVLNHLMFLLILELGGSPRSSTRSRSARNSSTSWRRSPAGACTTCSTASAASRRTSRPGWTTRARGAVTALRSRMGVYDDLVLGNEIFRGVRGAWAPSRRRPWTPTE